jgi:Arc/MetJ-type ribon-helix-helix transcriptional regulator
MKTVAPDIEELVRLRQVREALRDMLKHEKNEDRSKSVQREVEIKNEQGKPRKIIIRRAGER